MPVRLGIGRAAAGLKGSVRVIRLEGDIACPAVASRQYRTMSFLIAAVSPSTVSSNMGKTSRTRRIVVAP